MVPRLVFCVAANTAQILKNQGWRFNYAESLNTGSSTFGSRNLKVLADSKEHLQLIRLADSNNFHGLVFGSCEEMTPSYFGSDFR